MAPVDPAQLLKALNPLLGPNGAISGPTEATRMVSLMKDAHKIVSKCVYINILKLEHTQDVVDKFLSAGGWDVLNSWLQGCKEEENYPLMVELLKVYQIVPVTVEVLKTNNAAKTIKQLCKSDNDNVKTLASNIFEEWMKKVKGNNSNSNNNNNNENVKKKDKEKREKGDDKQESKSESKSSKSDKRSEKDNKTDKDSKHEKSESKSSKSDSKSDKKKDSKSDKDKDRTKGRESKSHHSSSHHNHHTSRDKKRESRDSHEDMETSSTDSSSLDDVAVVRKGSGLKLHIKLGGDKDRTESNKADKKDKDQIIKRPSTVKRPPSKFRSTGLEESNPPKTSKPSADLSKPIPKRPGADVQPQPPEKKSRTHMPPPLSVPSPVVTTPTTAATSPSTSSPTSPGETHGKIKIIPARPRANHEIHESTGFMDSLTGSSRTYQAYKKKKKAAAAAAGNGKVPSTPPSPMSPTTAVARTLPAVPSFYKDTQQQESEANDGDVKTEVKSEPGDEKAEIKIERSLSPPTLTADTEESSIGDIKSEVKVEVKIEPGSLDGTNAEDPSMEMPTLTKESKGLLTTGATKRKKTKKSVRWKEDHEIKQIFYFELDEDERENVNRPKDFNQAKRQEMIFDRRAMESARRMTNDMMVEQIPWYRPKRFAGVKQFDNGSESTERAIQKVREQSVLQALFFTKTMLPDAPQEPDAQHEEASEPKVMPLEDVSGGDQFLYNYDQHVQAVPNNHSVSSHMSHPPPVMPAPPHMSQPPPQLPPGPVLPPQQQQMFSLPTGLNLPPDLMNLIHQIQTTPHDPNDPVMSHVHGILGNIMSGATDQGYEQLQQIQQMMSSQMIPPPDGMMHGMPPPPGGMPPPPGMPPQGPPPMGNRPLLGQAPPGFMPQRPMGPPPNRFGQGPPGNWGGGGGMMGHGHQGGPGGGHHRGGGYRGRMSGPRPPRGRGKAVCRHYTSGNCRLGDKCGFLHTMEKKKK